LCAVFLDNGTVKSRIFILGVPIDVVTQAQAIERMTMMAQSGKQHHIMTPNPEMLVEAAKNPAFAAVLSRASLNVPDGVGVLLAARWFGSLLPERVTGTDLVERIAGIPDMQPVFFLGALPGVAERASTALAARHPELRVAGTWSGSPHIDDEKSIIERINASGAKTLLVAYGAPAQDLWIDRVLPRLLAVRVAMGIGGAFDFLAGTRKRAPKALQQIGLEWLWRLGTEPCRFRRIFRAVIVFPFLVLTHSAR
jgi:N-acetylglucosaminyldiphosphoundecaprenol N-acetyl-beta-D-mannosaminyltransferase